MITQYSVKDTPNISGALNNCALNCALPTLFAKINQISKSEIPATDNFKLFKTVFEEWYKFQEPISWLRFSELISKHNFPENQLIFAPILRQFMSKKGASVELCSIRKDTGRYSMLDSEDANQYFYRHFDFFMQQHHTDPDFIVQPELGHQAIQVYHRDAHFELKPIANITLAPEENRFRKILEKITGNASREATSEALIQLQSEFHKSAATSIASSLGGAQAISSEVSSQALIQPQSEFPESAATSIAPSLAGAPAISLEVSSQALIQPQSEFHESVTISIASSLGGSQAISSEVSSQPLIQLQSEFHESAATSIAPSLAGAPAISLEVSSQALIQPQSEFHESVAISIASSLGGAQAISSEVSSQPLIQLQSEFHKSAATSIASSLGGAQAISSELSSQALTNNRFFTRNNLIIAGTVTLSIGVIVTAFALAIPIAYALGALAALAIVALIALAIKNYCETPKAPLDLCVSNAG